MRFERLVLVGLLLAVATIAARADDASTIPLTLTQSEYGGGRVYLPVRFGNMMGSMRLDTGASTTRMTLAPWNKDLPVVGQSESTGSSGRTVRCDDVAARNVALQATHGADIARAKYDVTRCAASDGDDLLGLDFFKGARFALDFERREMIFGGAASARATAFAPLGPDRRLLGIDLRAGNIATVGLFDTGAEVSAVDRRFVEKHKSLFTLVKRKGKASEAGGRQFSSGIYKIKTLDIGEGRVLRDLYAIAYDFGALREALGQGTPIILGYNFVCRFKWVIDLSSPQQPKWDARLK
jgi:hypothetical protein